MEKAKKTERTRERIFSAALVEFGTKGYKDATLNSICENNNISKGLVYHNFKNKDEIYLFCVEYSIDAFLAFMMRNMSEDGGIQEYLNTRNEFFSANPHLGKIFFEAVLQPPKHLNWDIKALKGDFNAFENHIYRKTIKNMDLRDGVSEEQAIEYCRMINEIFNGYFNTADFEDIAFAGMISNYEEGLGKMVDMMFYGIANERPFIPQL